MNWQGRLEAWLNAIWYEGAPVPGWLGALEGLYRAGLSLRQHLPVHLEPNPVPVVVVGNLTAGGSGKTPLTIALCEALTAAGIAVAVLARGHGGSARRPERVTDPDPGRHGDEAALIAMRTGVPVVVGRDRAAALRLLVGCCRPALVIADDGLQHRHLRGDLEILVIDGLRRFGNGRLLPAGPLREPASRLDRIRWRVVNGGETGAGELPMRLSPRGFRPLAGGPLLPLTGLHGPVRALAGIGHPERFFRTLEGLGLEVVRHPFPDHHRYCAADLVFGDGLPLVMTEKDAIKCRLLPCPVPAYALIVDAGLPEALIAAVCTLAAGHSVGG